MQRIISLVPSITELLFDLGLNDEVVGITKFCVHPHEWFKTKQRVGGTKEIDIGKIRLLQPNLVIANKEENVKEQIEALYDFTDVLLTDVSNLKDAVEMIAKVGEYINAQQSAKEIIHCIEEKFASLDRQPATCKPTIYLIWQQPYMCVGGDTFISNMMQFSGFDNVFKQQNRYPVIDINELKAMRFEYLLLSSEPFPFKQKHKDELQVLLPGKKVLLVDGEMFSWYGSRLLKAADYFKNLQRDLSGN